MRLTPADCDERVEDFFRRLYANAPGGNLEVRCLSETKGAKSGWFGLPELLGAAQYARAANANGYDVFFGVNPRVWGGQEDASVLSGVALWADIDNLGAPDAAEVKLEELMDLPIAPSAAIYSGNGLHVYFFLKDSIDPAAEDWEIYCGGLKSYANLTGGDPKCVNPSRVLRFPGCYSYKRKRETLLWLPTLRSI